MNTIKRFIWFVLLLQFQYSPILAWEIVPGRPSVTAVGADANEQRLIVGLMHGGFWLSNDGGDTWEPITERVSPNNRPAGVLDIAILDEQADSIITRSGFSLYPSNLPIARQIVITADGGSTWYPPMGLGESSHSEFTISDCNDHQDLYYSTLTTFYKSQDFGETWGDGIELDEHFNQKFTLMQDPMNDSSLFVSTFYTEFYPGGVLRSLDLGNTWEAILENGDYLVEHESVAMSDIDRLSNGDLLVTIWMSMRPSRPVDGFLRSSDNGQLWIEEYPLPESYYPRQVIEFPSDAGHLLVRADYYAYPSISTYLYESFDYGQTFAPIAEPALHDLVNVDFLTSNPYRNATYAGTRGNGAWKTEDNGATWQELPTPPVSSFCNANHPMEFTSHVQEQGLTGYFKRDNDTEYTEFTYPYPPPDTSQFAFPLFAVHGDTLRGLYFRNVRTSDAGHLYVAESYDNGTTWNDPIQELPADMLFNVTPMQSCEDGGIWYNMIMTAWIETGGWRLYITENGGGTWHTEIFPVYTASSRSNFTMRDGLLYAVHPEQDIHYKALNDENWDTLYHPNPSYLKYPHAVIIDDDIESIYTLTSVNGYRYLDGEWTQLGVLPYSNVNYATAIPREGMEPILIVGTHENPHLYVSYDGGYEWDTITLPFHEQMTQTEGVYYDQYRNRVWANTRVGLMWEDASVFTSVEEADAGLPTSHDLLLVYPNPFNAQTTVRIQLQKPDDVQLTLFNMLGQEVRTLVNEHLAVGEHSVTIDGSTLASGTYFLRLTTRDGTAATRKLELIR